MWKIAWRGYSGWSVWHLPRFDGQRMLCGIVPTSAVTKKEFHLGETICTNCMLKFAEPLI